MGKRIRTFDWSATPLGPLERWPQSLRTALSIMLDSKFPTFVAWGPELTSFYNDAYRPILGTKPEALGRPFPQVWAEAWRELEPIVARALAGEASYFENLPIIVERKGYPEQTWWTFSYSPVRDERGEVGGVWCTVQETTPTVLAEREHRAEVERLRELFQQAPSAVALLHGPEHVFEMVNPAYLQLIGHRDVIGKRIGDALPEVAAQGFIDLLDRVYQTGEPHIGHSVSVQLQRQPDGEPESRLIDLVFQPVRDAAGRISGILAQGIDVTERVRAEEALRESEARHRTLAEQSPDAILVNAGGRFVYANEAAVRLLHAESAEQIIGRASIESIAPEYRTLVQERIERLRAGLPIQPLVEQRWQRLDGSLVDVEVTAAAIEWEGQPAIQVLIRDVSERKQAESALRDQARALEILNHTGKIVAAELDLQRAVQVVTDAATELSGAAFGAYFHNQRDPSGQGYGLYTLSGAAREAFARFPLVRPTALLGATLLNAAVVRSDDITQDPRFGRNGPIGGMPAGHLPVRSYLAVPVISRTGEILGGLLFGHPEPGVFTEQDERLVVGIAAQAAIAIDNARLYEAAQNEIAERKRAEEALREADRRKDEFLATLAHELRNPLAPIRNAVQVLKTPGAGEPQRRWCRDVIDRQVQQMARLLDDLLDVARITRGKIELRKERMSIHAAVEAAIEAARPLINAKAHTLSLQLPTEPLWIDVDPTRMAQILGNLLTNAAKYTPAGGRIRVVAGQEGNETVIRVQDSGIGMTEAQRSQLFEMFAQAPEAIANAEGGLGVGLAITKGLVELHGGRIEARSEGPGKGSEFIVRLPLA